MSEEKNERRFKLGDKEVIDGARREKGSEDSELHSGDEDALEQARRLALRSGPRPDKDQLYDPAAGQSDAVPGEEPVTPEEARAVGAEPDEDDEDDEALDKEKQEAFERMMREGPGASVGQITGRPPWARLPPNFSPPTGEKVVYARFPSVWTKTPEQGVKDPLKALCLRGMGGICNVDPKLGRCEHGKPGGALFRQVIIWSLTEHEYEMAISLAHGKQGRIESSLIRMTMRYIDGRPVDHVKNGMPYSSKTFWNAVGKKCHGKLGIIYNELHTMSASEAALFFDECLSVETAG